MKHLLFVIFSLLLTSAPGHAEFLRNPVFAPGDTARPASLGGLKEFQFKDHKHERYSYGPISFVFREDEKDLKGAPVLKVLDGFGKTIFGPTPLFGGPAVAFGPLWIGDLNADHKPDYMVFSGSGGCGLAGDKSRIFFILSNDDEPEVFAIDTYGFEPKDVLRLPDGGTGVYVTRVIQTNLTPDRVYHSYLVTDVVRFDGKTEPGFPRWRRYNNHSAVSPVTFVSEANQKKLWAEEIKKSPLLIQFPK